MSTEVLSKAHGGNIVHYRQQDGVHGASTLVKSRNPGGHAANLRNFEGFLRRVGR